MAPVAASPGWRLCWRPQGRLLWWRPGMAPPGWRLRGGVSGGVEGRPGGRCGPGPRSLPASPAWHTGSRVSRPSRGPGRWQLPRCDAAVARTTTMWHRGGCRRGEGGWRAGAPADVPATRRPPPATRRRRQRPVRTGSMEHPSGSRRFDGTSTRSRPPARRAAGGPGLGSVRIIRDRHIAHGIQQ
jgi:hypothetical protein